MDRAGKIREIVKGHNGRSQDSLIKRLNRTTRGWTNYHRHIQSSIAFSKLDTEFYKILCKWGRRQNRNVTRKWLHKHYFRDTPKRNWTFCCKVTDKNGKKVQLDLFYHSQAKITRYVKIKAAANPFNPEYASYFEERIKSSKTWATISNNKFNPKSPVTK